MSNNCFTTIAALPSAGGCMSSLPPENTGPTKVQMRAAYFEDALEFPPIDYEEIPPEAGGVTKQTMEQLGQNLERRRAKGGAQ